VTMLVPGLLAGYALALAAAGTWWLPRASWPRRLPRLGIAAWQVLTVSFVASVLLAGLLIAIPCLPDGVNLDAAAELHDHYSSARGILTGAAAAAASLTVIGRLIWAAMSALAMARRRRARHDETLALVGRPGPVPGLVVLDDDRPLVYCLPGRDRVVITTGALNRLDHAQLQAVLAHERAHLSARHHLAIMLARVMPDALPGIRFLAIAADQIGSLAEMAADDSAARQHRLPLAHALLALAATSPVPAAALGAAPTAGGQRIRRLLDTPRPATAVGRAAGITVTLLAAPVLALAVPVCALLAAPDCLHRPAHQPPAVSRALTS
jgi:Zn-dependent protease with chaperone function